MHQIKSEQLNPFSHNLENIPQALKRAKEWLQISKGMVVTTFMLRFRLIHLKAQMRHKISVH